MNKVKLSEEIQTKLHDDICNVERIIQSAVNCLEDKEYDQCAARLMSAGVSYTDMEIRIFDLLSEIKTPLGEGDKQGSG